MIKGTFKDISTITSEVKKNYPVKSVIVIDDVKCIVTGYRLNGSYIECIAFNGVYGFNEFVKVAEMIGSYTNSSVN